MPITDLVDDTSIPDENPLWRRIPPWHLIQVGQGNYRPSSAAFGDHPDGSPMSVFVVGAESNIDASLLGHPGFGLVEFSTGLARQLQQGVRRVPLAHHLDHGEVFGRKTTGVKRAFSRNAVWIQLPTLGE